MAPKQEPRLPGVGVMAKGLAGAVVRTLARVASGRSPVLPGEEKQRRHAICQANQCGEYRKSDDRCAACGCYARAKVWLTSERCPRGLW